uniref:Uncharacterized protein n=1 Tax=Amblyomma maculatum TaxID=34609 RepID=G3MTR8_AMBMU
MAASKVECDESSSGNTGVAAMDPSVSENETLKGRATAIQEQLHNTHRQIMFLDQQIRDLKRLYERAVKNNNYPFRYSIRMKMSIATGIKMMYYHYGSTKLAELEHITTQMEEARSTASDSSDGDSV